MSQLRDEIVASMARTLFVVAWAQREEEKGRTYPGQDLMDVAPKTSPKAEAAAKKLALEIEEMNDASLDALLVLASMQPGKHYKESYSYDFGYGLAMQALGHGVSWWDDHPYISVDPVIGVEKEFKLPRIEFYL